MEVTKAAEDILNNPRFEGAINTIKGVTQWTDVGFATVITFVAFMIICVSMLRNVLAAAYCAYPKFWDHVNEAHKNKQGKGFIQQTFSMFQGGPRGGTGGGQSVGDIIYGVIPDIKRMTDFEEGKFSAKHYFMKAIPQMLICVSLGAFIYNGTYRDVAALWVDTGTTLINRTLLEIDPIAMFDDFTGTAGRPVFRSDNAVDQFTQNQNEIATDLYTQIIGTFKDIRSAEQKRLLADACDDEARRMLDAMSTNDKSSPWVAKVIAPAGVTSPTEYRMKHSSTWSSADMSAACAARVGQVGENPPQYQYAYCSSLASMGIENISSEAHPDFMYVVHMLQFTESTKDVSTGSARDLVLKIAAGSNIQLADDFRITGSTVRTTASSGNGALSLRVGYEKDEQSTSHMRIKVIDYKLETSAVGEVLALSVPFSINVTAEDGATEEHTVTAIQITDKADDVGTVYSKDVPTYEFNVTGKKPAKSYADTAKEHRHPNAEQ